MGNRGTVVFTDGEDRFSPAIYLHWNGGPESVLAFLDELDRRGVRADQDYEAARFIVLIGQFFDKDTIGTLSLGVANGPASDSLEDLAKIQTDKGDNGIYLVDRTKTPTVIRWFTEKFESTDNGDFTITMVEEPSLDWDKALIKDYRQQIGEQFKADSRALTEVGL